MGLHVEERTTLLHGSQDVAVAAHPGETAGPAPSFHVKAAVLPAQLLDHLFERLRPGWLGKPLPDALLHDGLDGGEVLLAEADGVEVLQVLADVDRGRIRARGFAGDVEVLRWKFVHHDAPVFAVGDLDHQGRHGFPG